MKKINFNYTFMVLSIISMIFISSCSSNDDNEDDNTNNEYQTTLVGTQSETVRTLIAGNTYTLSGEYKVPAGKTLKIEAGVTITAQVNENTDYILIEKHGKIDARGTASNPIVMTSNQKKAGDWAGLHICGDAKINLEGGTGLSEVGNSPYGGNNDHDNSGVISYMRVEYAGQKLNEAGTKEGNGITFYGVGDGTTVDHCQAYKGTDDGFEFFGGCVNIKYMVSTNNSDDAFDWTQGWRGKAQFLVAYQESKTILGYDCDALMECDNLENNNSNEPISHPIIANVTLIGNNSNDEKRGIRLRAGTEISLYNALVMNKARCLTTQTAETEAAASNGTTILSSVYLQNTVTSEDGGYSETKFLASGTNKINYSYTFTNKYVGVVEGGSSLSSLGSFFTNVDYVGAVKTGDDWTEGWSIR